MLNFSMGIQSARFRWYKTLRIKKHSFFYKHIFRGKETEGSLRMKRDLKDTSANHNTGSLFISWNLLMLKNSIYDSYETIGNLNTNYLILVRNISDVISAYSFV